MMSIILHCALRQNCMATSLENDFKDLKILEIDDDMAVWTLFLWWAKLLPVFHNIILILCIVQFLNVSKLKWNFIPTEKKISIL